MDKYGLSETEYNIILKQIERRKKYRKEFLKLRTDPCQQSREAGYVIYNVNVVGCRYPGRPRLTFHDQITLILSKGGVKSPKPACLYEKGNHCEGSLTSVKIFDEGLQRYISMHATQAEFFKATPKTAFTGFMIAIFPMLAYGTLVYFDRKKFLEDCACGRIKYRDRLFKYC